MATKNFKEYRRKRIKLRIRKVVKGTADRPRMTVFRSNKEIYVQMIDDQAGNTLISASSLKDVVSDKNNKIDQAKKVGLKIAEIAKQAGIEQVVFDRGGYLYHGRVKALAEAAREGGLKF
jgi:large subunit ribosomal protein L18